VCYHDAVERTTLSIPGPVLERLRVAAAERGVSMAEFVRQALEEKLAASRPTPGCLGIGASGHNDTARRTSDERPEPRSWR
jgi:hypothetical protein